MLEDVFGNTVRILGLNLVGHIRVVKVLLIKLVKFSIGYFIKIRIKRLATFDQR